MQIYDTIPICHLYSQDGVSLITELINSEMKNISEFGDGKGLMFEVGKKVK